MKKNVAYERYDVLIDAVTGQFAVDPPIAAGDFQVQIDGGAFADLATTPVVTPPGSRSVKIVLSAAEMDGDKIVIIGSDPDGAWSDFQMLLEPEDSDLDALAAQIAALSSALGVAVAAILAAIGTRAAPGAAMTLTTGQVDAIVSAILDLADALEPGDTLRESLRDMLASGAGQTAGAGTDTFELKSLNGAKVRGTYDIDPQGDRVGYTRGDKS